MKLTLALATLVLLAAAGTAQEPAASPAAAAPAPSAKPAAPPYAPKSPDDKARSQSEYNSIAYARTVLANEREYKKKMGRYSASLMALAGGGRSFTKRMARADRGDYTVQYRGGKEGFSVTLVPKQFDETRRSFYLDSSGVLRVQEGAPATAGSDPL
ncbi:MAG TPA: hypothetical protein VLA96_08575 [Terriglobales bacterium]|nr:hypothetical protein [Terriglobales bacterium]